MRTCIFPKSCINFRVYIETARHLQQQQYIEKESLSKVLSNKTKWKGRAGTCAADVCAHGCSRINIYKCNLKGQKFEQKLLGEDGEERAQGDSI